MDSNYFEGILPTPEGTSLLDAWSLHPSAQHYTFATSKQSTEWGLSVPVDVTHVLEYAEDNHVLPPTTPQGMAGHTAFFSSALPDISAGSKSTNLFPMSDNHVDRELNELYSNGSDMSAARNMEGSHYFQGVNASTPGIHASTSVLGARNPAVEYSEMQSLAIPGVRTGIPKRMVLKVVPQERYQAKPGSQLAKYQPKIVFQRIGGRYLSIRDALAIGVAGLEEMLQNGKQPAFEELSRDKIRIIIQWRGYAFFLKQIRARAKENHTIGWILHKVAEETKKFLQSNGQRQGHCVEIDQPGRASLLVGENDIYITALKHVSKAGWQVEFAILVELG